MKCSILIPSRGNMDDLLLTVNSCLSNAHDPNQIEIIIRIDSDDLEYISRVNELLDFKRVQVIIGHRGEGFFSLQEQVNDCARLSKGNWLLCLNDDAQIVTKDWEETLPSSLSPAVVNPIVDWPTDKDSPAYKLFCERPRVDFPMISRDAYKRIGVFSPSPVFDWFWDEAVRQVPALGGTVGCFTIHHDYRVHVCESEVNDRKMRVHRSLEVEMKQCIERLK